MRWERFFGDLEDQLASEWEAERAALDTEAERLRLSRVTLRERLRAFATVDGEKTPVTIEFVDGARIRATIAGVGADWASLLPVTGTGATLAPLDALAEIAAPHAEILRSARPLPESSALSDRVTFGFAVRDLVRRRVPVTVHLARSRMLHGTIDRAGADHLDLALHEAGSARRAESVTGHRLVPYREIARMQLDAPLLPL